MRKYLKTRGVDLAITVVALIALMPEPAWALSFPNGNGLGNGLAGPAAGGLVGAAIIGAIVIAKWWRRK